MDYFQTQERSGKGGAVKRSLEYIDSDYVILMDADDSIQLNSVLQNLHFLTDYDVVILSRYEKKMNHIPLSEHSLAECSMCYLERSWT